MEDAERVEQRVPARRHVLEFPGAGGAELLQEALPLRVHLPVQQGALLLDLVLHLMKHQNRKLLLGWSPFVFIDRREQVISFPWCFLTVQNQKGCS